MIVFDILRCFFGPRPRVGELWGLDTGTVSEIIETRGGRVHYRFAGLWLPQSKNLFEFRFIYRRLP